MNIRIAQQSDIASATFLWFERIALLQQTDTYFTPLDDASQVWQTEATKWLQDDDVIFYVAEQDSHLLGYIVVSIIAGPVGLRPKRIGTILDMSLDLHHAHSGLGGQLINTVKLWLADNNIRVLTVNLPARYPVEEAFWLSQGAKLRFNEFWMLI